jgi:hypothetical protein
MLSGDLPGGTWSSSSGLASVSSVGVVKGVSAGNTRISYILPTGCYDYAPVTVDALSPITGGTNGMCASGSMTLVNNTVGGGVWSSSNSAAATVNASGLVRGSSAGVTVISFTTNAAGCVATKTITVNPCRQGGGATSVDGVTEELGDVQLFPNPNNGTFTLVGGIDVYGGDVVIEVADMLGKTVFRGAVTVYDGRMEKQITLPDNLANGTYMLSLTATDIRKIYHFVVNH